MPRRGDAGLPQFVLANPAVEEAPGLPVAHRAHAGQLRVELECSPQRAQLLHQSRFQHCVEAIRNAPVQLGAVLRHEREGPQFEGQFLLAGGLQLRQGLPGQFPDLERALDALRVVGRESRRGRRIEARKIGMQRRPAVARGARIDLRAQSGFGLRQRVDALRQGSVVKHRAANQQRNFPSSQDFKDDAGGVFPEAARGIGPGRVEQVDEVMGDGAPFRRRGLRGADIHAAVDLRRIDADDLDRVLRSEFHRQPRLAAGGGAQQRVSDAWRGH